MKNIRSITGIIIFHFLLYVNYSFSQTKIDSLKTELDNAKEDTTKVNLLNELAWKHRKNDTQKALEFAKQALFLSKRLNNSKLKANSYHQIASANYVQGNYQTSLDYNFKALQIRKKLNNKEGIASSLGNIGIIYTEQGNYPSALKYLFEALKISKILGNEISITIWQGNIGSVYFYQGNYPNALKYFNEALEIDKKLGNKSGITTHLGNIGNVYMIQGNYSGALAHYFRALEISNELGNKSYTATWLGNIASVYRVQGDSLITPNAYTNALKYYFKALELSREVGNKKNITIWLGHIGSLYAKQKKYKEAEQYLKEALFLCDSIGVLYDKMQFEKIISEELYVQTHNYQFAYQHYKKYSATKDSLFNEEKSKEIGRLEQMHEFEMEEMEQERTKNEELRIKNEEIKRRNLLQCIGILLALFFLFTSIFLLARRFRKIKEYKNYLRYIKIVEATLFISFLIFFEFILVFLDPYLEKITGGEPAYKLLVNVILAAVIFPLHSFLEAKLKESVMRSEDGSTKPEEINGSKTMLLLAGFAFISLFNTSFSDKTDSLKTALTNTKEDTIRVKILNDLAWELRYQNPDTSITLGKKTLELAERLPSPLGEVLGMRSKLIANSNSDLGVYYDLKGDYSLSLSHHFKALEIRKQLNDKNGIAASLGNIGIVCYEQGNYPKALQHYFEALEIDKGLRNKNGIEKHLGNIGIVYHEQASAAKSRQDVTVSNFLYAKALQHYFEALEIAKELGNKNGMANNLGNIGLIYSEQVTAAKSQQGIAGIDSLYTKALKYYFEALELAKELGAKSTIAINLGNIGLIYSEQARTAKSRQDITDSDSLYASALKHYFEALKIDKELENKRDMAIWLGNIGSLYTQTGRFKKAEVYLDSALAICDTIGTLNYTMQLEEIISHLYNTTARYQLAYQHYKKYSVAKDSLFNEEKSKEIGRLEQVHQFELEELKNERIKNEKLRITNEKIKRRNILQYSTILLTLVFLFGLVFFVGRISIPEWLIGLSTFVPFMILFEFILVLLDPYIENYAGGEPLYKLFINAACAMILFPIHSFFEKKLKTRIYEIKLKKEEKFAEEFRQEVKKLEENTPITRGDL